jgi:hypothetical protein
MIFLHNAFMRTKLINAYDVLKKLLESRPHYFFHKSENLPNQNPVLGINL